MYFFFFIDISWKVGYLIYFDKYLELAERKKKNNETILIITSRT